MKKIIAVLSCSVCMLAQNVAASSKAAYSSLPFSYDKPHRHVVIQMGGYLISRGLSQHVSIDELVGNQYTLSQHHASNALVGLGYFLDGSDIGTFQMNYGINGYYLPHTPVNGNIAVENFFTNLSYRYQIQHVPVYLVTEARLKNHSQHYQVALTAGVGVDFMRTFNYEEAPLNSNAVPQNNFAQKTQETFTAMTGIGLRFNHVFGEAPLECGYRFFYLGQGSLKINNDLYQNALKTGSNYVNALLCSVTI
ncbi:MAG: hypothetical protein NTW08_01950 [Gammaproteobacteria bacterium]|nr:hypothetical protein [Gammaproteobacteria bacterium]